jgi:hypothetical protein
MGSGTRRTSRPEGKESGSGYEALEAQEKGSYKFIEWIDIENTQANALEREWE